jgi:AraC-like DNA-binding protein
MSLQLAHKLRSIPCGPRPQTFCQIAHIDLLRYFPELVQRLGGDPEQLLQQAGIEPAVLCEPGAVIDYRARLRLMECAAMKLSCPEFGLRLATMFGDNPNIGPIGVIMKNSKTLGQAIGHLAKHAYAYTRASRVRLELDRANHRMLVWSEILLDGTPDRRQAIEHAFMLAALQIIKVTGGAARARKIMFSHQPHSSIKTYRAYFGCDVGFGEKADGLVLNEDDLLCPIVDPDFTVYEMATSFIEARYPHTESPLHARVRNLIREYLGTNGCTSDRVAVELSLHQRTLQRRLCAEGTSFETIKDEVRREVALHYIRNYGLSLKRLAEVLGYSETSVVSRNFKRWFSATPRELIRSRETIAAAR